MNNNGNILLQQLFVDVDGSSFKFKEIIPLSIQSNNLQALIKKGETINWLDIDLSLNILIDNKFKDTDIYYDKGRIGVGRSPLYNYKIDVAIPKNKLMTAFHVGDGSFGFSMGNGTTEGFIPEIIGIGSNENDAGLYFVAVAGNNILSDIPLIILDGRNTFGKKLHNRPILGITSGNYNEYAFLVDASSNLNIKGDLMLNNISLLNTIKNLQEQVEYLKTKIT